MNTRNLSPFFLCLLFLLTQSRPGAGQSQPFNFVASPLLSQNGRVSSSLSHFTGKLGLSVPIYSYKSPSSNLALSISLDYSGGGLNVFQQGSAIGAGWSLSAGGSVFRSINGLPDDRPNSGTSGYFYNAANIADNPCCIDYQGPGNYADPINKTHQDSEEDDYYFDLNGRQGKLLIPRDILQTGSYTAIQTIPQSTCRTYLSQAAVPANTSTTVSEIVITDESGIEYHFGGVETMQRKISTLVSDGNNNYHYTYTFPNEYFITTWRITKMIDVNTSDEIDFNYTDYNVSYKQPDFSTTYTNLGNLSYSTYNNPQDLYKGTSKRLSSVSFKNGDVVSFTYDSRPRADFVSDNALTQIRITSPIPGKQVSFNLKQSYLYESLISANTYQVTEMPYNNVIVAPGQQDQLGNWLFLKGITQVSADGNSELPVASFGYHRTIGTESTVSVPTRFSAAGADNWGLVSPGTQRLFGSMDTVFSVNGGYTLYQYEFNNYRMSDGTAGSAGGLRVKNITQYDGMDHARDMVTSYSYQLTNGNSSGFTTSLPPNYYQNALVDGNGGSVNYAVTLPYTSGMVSATLIQGSPVGYGRVAESVAGSGQTVYEFTTTADYPPLYTTLNYPFPNKLQIADWAYGLPRLTSTFDNNGRLLRTVQNDYNVAITPLTTPNYRSMKMAYRTEAPGPVFGNQTCAQTASVFNFTYEFYYPVTGLVQIAQSIAREYPVNGRMVTNTTQYAYDPSYYVTTRTTTFNSKGEKIEQVPFYYFQAANTGTTPYGYASAYNLLASPYGSLAVLTKTDGTKYIVSHSRINYQVVGGMLKPQQILSAKLAAPVSIDPAKNSYTPEENYGAATSALSMDETYDQYDAAGTLLQSSSPSQNLVKSSIWDYSLKKQVAESNAGFNTIDYTSFENNQLGGWTMGTGSTLLSGGITGTTAFSGTLSKTLSAAGNYTVTLWSSTGAGSTVNGLSGTVLATRGNYQLRSWTLNNVSSIQVAGSNIDELRLYPQGASMSTCTFSPLVGITSRCDANNQIIYYEYDPFNRIMDIRDQDGNILKTYEYHYKGQ